MLSIAQSQRLACWSWCPRRTVRHPQDLLVRRCLEGLEGSRPPLTTVLWVVVLFAWMVCLVLN